MRPRSADLGNEDDDDEDDDDDNASMRPRSADLGNVTRSPMCLQRRGGFNEAEIS